MRIVRLDELFSSKKMPLIVSLPANNVVIARAAVSAGADALKVHLNVSHAASGTLFGGFEDERGSIEKILSSVSVPVGVMPGAETTATIPEMEALAEMGVGFFDIYDVHMPEEYWKFGRMDAMVALGMDSPADAVERLNRAGVKFVEVSIIPHKDYGTPMSMQDLQHYAGLAERLTGIVTVPTQKRILPNQVRMLSLAGVRGLMIGKIVTGDNALTIRDAVKKFRREIDLL